MENLKKILNLDNDFINKYENMIFSDDNLDEFTNAIEIYDNERTRLIKLVNLAELGHKIKPKEIENIIYNLKHNQSMVTNIIFTGQNFCKKKLTTISKTKKINIYRIDEVYQSNFIDIVK